MVIQIKAIGGSQ